MTDRFDEMAERVRLDMEVLRLAPELRTRTIANALREAHRRGLDDASAELQAQSESWRLAHQAWQYWATDLLSDLGRQPLGGEHGDGPAREIIAQLAGMAPGVPRCLRCGCFSTRHEVDDEELRGCEDCECEAFQAP